MSRPSADEGQEFLEAMERLRRVPDKDGKRTSPVEPGRVRRRKRKWVVEERLDLHGRTAEAAEGALLAFVAAAKKKGRRRVLVITGRGRGSAGGVGVLGSVVDAWARGPGRPLVAAVSSAPKELGGSGARVLELR